MCYSKKILAIVIAVLIIMGTFPVETLDAFAETANAIVNDIGESVNALSEIFISDETTQIESNAYRGNSELTSVTIPKSVTLIGENAFDGCENLIEINYGGTRADFAKIDIKDGNEIIANAKINYTYSDVSEGLEIVWRESPASEYNSYSGYFVTGIGTCTDSELVLPETYNGEKVIGIDASAFEGNENIIGIYVPSCITYINTRAFANCTNLVWAELHGAIDTSNELANRGYAIFSGCSFLEFLYTVDIEFISGTMNGWTDYHPVGFLFGSGYYKESTACTQYYWSSHTAYMTAVSYYFPNSLKTVELGNSYCHMTNPFQGCTTIEKIFFSGSVYDECLAGFEGLKEVFLLSNVNYIGAYAFSGCSNLQNITIPSSVETIGGETFRNCTSLTNITIAENSNLKNIGTNILEGCTAFEAINISNINDWGKISFPDISSNLISSGISLLLNGNIVKNADLQEGITEIGAYAFANYTELLGVNIPSSLEKIGASAFSGCASIKKVNICNLTDWFNIDFANANANPISISNKMYLNGALVTDVTVPNEITTIKDYVFYNYSTLNNINLHENIEHISSTAFYGCNITETVDNVSYIDSWVVGCDSSANNLVIRDGTTGIFKGAFSGKNFNSIILPSSLKYIGENAFKGSAITDIKIPASVKDLKQNTFLDCTYLKTVTFEEGSILESIGYKTFGNNSALTDIEIPSSILSIDNDAFSGCASLNYNHYNGIEYLGNNNKPYLYLYSILDTSVSSYSVSEQTVLIKDSAFSNCTALESIVFDNNNQIKEIGKLSFDGLSTLKNIDFGDNSSLTTIENSAFSTCTALESISFGNNSKIKEIGKLTFSGLSSSLKNIDFGDESSLESIGDSAFCNFQNLQTVDFGENSKLKTIGSQAFYRCNQYGNITIPPTVTYIGSGAYGTWGSEGLNRNIYISDISAWCNIEFENNYSNPMVHPNSNRTTAIYLNDEPLTQIELTDDILKINDFTFYGCSELTTVTLPDSITSIGNSSFYGCNKLSSLKIPQGVTSIGYCAFYNCSSLTEINIPDSVTSIGNSAFSGCSKLTTSITIPNGITSIGSDTFYNCSSLTEINIPDSVTSIGNYAFSGCSKLTTSITIPNGTTSIGNGTFYNCSSLTEINIPYSVTSIGNYAFSGCSKLTSIKIPQGVTSIGSSAFSGCQSLTDITIPNTVTHIPDYLFADCYSLESVIFSEGVVSIGESAFEWCGNLTTVNIPDSVTEIGEYAFYCSALENISLGNGVENIGSSAFEGCYSLKEIFIPGSVTSMGSYAFEDCDSLKNVTFGDGIKSIDSYVFYDCGRLTSVTIPNSVTTIEYMAFYYCDSLSTVYFCGTQAEWNKITISSYNENLTSADRFYHNYSFEILKEPDCTTKGEQEVKCIICGHSENRSIPALGHKKEVWGTYEPENPIEFTNDETYPFVYNNGRYESDVTESYTSATFTITALYDCTLNLKFNISDAAYDYPGNLPLSIWTDDYSYDYSIYVGAESNTSDRNETINLDAGDNLHISFYQNYYSEYDYNYGWFEIVSCVGEAEGYHWVSTDTLEATCTESVICGVCDTVVKQAGHKYSYRSSTSATCTSSGRQSYYYCTACYKYFNTSYKEVTYSSLAIPAKGHNYGEWIDAIPKTCTTNGQKGHYKCSNCNYYFDENKNRISSIVISASHNVSQWHNEVSASCEETGILGYYECADCGKYLNSNKNILETIIIPAKGHSKKNFEISNSTTYPFALNDGVYNSTNKSHSSSSTFTITALKDFALELQYYTSTESSYDKLTITHNSTVLKTASGSTSWQTFSVTMKSGDKLYIKYTKDGSVSSGTDSIYFKILSQNIEIDEFEPTCLEGVICDACGKTVKPANGHNYGEWIAPQPHTCENDGVLGHYECADCGVYFNEAKQEITSLVDPAAHNFGSWNYKVHPTCEQDGRLGHYECLGCGKYFDSSFNQIDSLTISALGHDHSVWITEVLPSCTEKGYKYSKCPRCEDLQKEALAATGHNILNGKCSICDVGNETVESQHNYGNSVEEEYLIVKEGAVSLTITFSADTETEEYFDTIAIFDQNNELLGTYSGTELASKSFTINGDTVKIILTSDVSVNAYGFKAEITAAYSSCLHTNVEWITDLEPTFDTIGHKNKHCKDCNKIVGEADIFKLSYGDANTDGTINLQDVSLLAQAIAGWDITANEATFDVDGNGIANLRDLVLLAQFVAGWEVLLN